MTGNNATNNTGCCCGNNSEKNYYYDVVVSIYSEFCRTQSHPLCGGFASIVEALSYIDSSGVSEKDYERCCGEGESPYIDIEVRDDTASIVEVITVS